MLIQQIVIEEQATLLAGPHTCEAPLPEQQYGAPDVQTFCDTVFGQLPFFPGGVSALRLSSSLTWGLGPSSEDTSDEISDDGSARGIASSLDMSSRDKVGKLESMLGYKNRLNDWKWQKDLQRVVHCLEAIRCWGIEPLSDLHPAAAQVVIAN